jgi:phenylacetic acid degradation operon negative regulatory protein
MPTHTTSRAQNNNLSLAKTILATLYDIGSGTIKAFFPHPYYHTFCKHKHYSSFRPTLYRLRKHGLIKQRATKDGTIFHLTHKGEHEAFLAYINAEAYSYKAKPKQKWDGIWRIVFFDIPEKQRHKRDYFRSIIKMIGFKQFQKSIWVYPYHVPVFLTRLLQDESILPYTRFISTSHIDYDIDMKKMFSIR